MHVWGCPVYVLDPALQSGKKIPKWSKQARIAQIMGFLEQHSLLVPKVQNLETGHVSPQYHAVFDDKVLQVFACDDNLRFVFRLLAMLDGNPLVFSLDSRFWRKMSDCVPLARNFGQQILMF